ncbi:hypothetical protein BgiMline_006855 [Biomphalaria glabrata]|nr:hypothetical protein BgiMline_004717 [Biomphalaria glabrata]KAI8794988.1 hypothetical protein BgiBS90_005364 [Biomphalaria glabrata]
MTQTSEEDSRRQLTWPPRSRALPISGHVKTRDVRRLLFPLLIIRHFCSSPELNYQNGSEKDDAAKSDNHKNDV